MDGTGLLDDAFGPLSGRDFYRANALRLAGLDRRASTSDIRRRRTEVQAAVRLGTPLPGGAAETDADPEQVLAALDDLRRRPVLRFVHELLWVWADGPDPDELAAEHDALVVEHRALLAEDWSGPLPGLRREGLDARWREVLLRWSRLLDRPELWERLRRRAAEYADARVTARTVDELRAQLPARILAVNAAIAAHAVDQRLDGAERHVALVRDAPFAPGLGLTALRARSRRTEDRITAACEAARREVGRRPDGVPRIAVELLDSAAPDLRVVSRLLGASDATPRALHDRVAGTVNGLCVAYVNDAVDDDLRDRAVGVLAPLSRAAGLATDRELRELLRQNRSRVEDATRFLPGRRHQPLGFARAADEPPEPPGPRPSAAQREREKVAERSEWERRLAEREERLRTRTAEKRDAEVATREQRRAEYEARQANLAREREAAARAAAEHARAEAERRRSAPPPPTGATPNPPGGAPAPATARPPTRNRVEEEIVAMARAGEVERAGWILRRWALDRFRDKDLERRLTALLLDPRRISHTLARPVRARAFLGCGTRLVRTRAAGRCDPQIWLQCIAVLWVPLFALRAGLRDGRTLTTVVPLPPAARRARVLGPVLAVSVLVGALIEVLNRLVSGPPAGQVDGVTAAGAVLIVGLLVALCMTFSRMGRAQEWLTEHRAL